MPSLETYRKHAKQLLRWHRDRNYSVGEKLRLLARFQHLDDKQILDMDFPLTLAQEVVAVEAGFVDWAALKVSAMPDAVPKMVADGAPAFFAVTPILFVRDVEAAAGFYTQALGFDIDFLHGKPPFYGAVSRGNACLHLRHVDRPNFAALAAHEVSLILASVEVRNVKALFGDYEARGVDFAQRLVRQAWGGLDFHVRDPDGNVISFVEYSQPPAQDR